MALPTILAQRTGTVTVARSKPSVDRTEAENYEIFRAIKDAQFVEPIRASRADVQDVADQIQDWLKPSIGRNTIDNLVFQKGATPEYVSKSTSDWNDHWNGFGARPASPAGTYEVFGFQTSEGISRRMEISPGTLRFLTSDENRKEKTRARALAEKVARTYYAAVEVGPYPELPDNPDTEAMPSRGEVTEWSAKSRSKMQLRIPGLDFSEWLQSQGTLAMVTLTLPGDWEVLVPDGKTFKKLVTRFLNRWRRAVEKKLTGLWKLEFQGEGKLRTGEIRNAGAPHLHALLRVPALVKGEIFEQWLSRTWADVCGASKEIDGLDRDGNDDSEYLRHLRAGTGVDYSGRDYTDPRRISQYFAGHSAKHADGKEYQHIVPLIWQGPGKGPGRFWGYWGLEPATVQMEMEEQDSIRALRIARKIRKAQSWKIAVGRTAGKAKGDGIELPKGWQHGVEAPKPRSFAGGRSAHRTYNLRRWFEAQETGQPWKYQARVVNKALGQSGGFVGGWIQVNDGIQLAYDLSRALLAARTDYQPPTDRQARIMAYRAAQHA